jgi:hypothetical protein
LGKAVEVVEVAFQAQGAHMPYISQEVMILIVPGQSVQNEVEMVQLELVWWCVNGQQLGVAGGGGAGGTGSMHGGAWLQLMV